MRIGQDYMPKNEFDFSHRVAKVGLSLGFALVAAAQVVGLNNHADEMPPTPPITAPQENANGAMLRKAAPKHADTSISFTQKAATHIARFLLVHTEPGKFLTQELPRAHDAAMGEFMESRGITERGLPFEDVPPGVIQMLMESPSWEVGLKDGAAKTYGLVTEKGALTLTGHVSLRAAEHGNRGVEAGYPADISAVYGADVASREFNDSIYLKMRDYIQKPEGAQALRLWEQAQRELDEIEMSRGQFKSPDEFFQERGVEHPSLRQSAELSAPLPD